MLQKVFKDGRRLAVLRILNSVTIIPKPYYSPHIQSLSATQAVGVIIIIPSIWAEPPGPLAQLQAWGALLAPKPREG